MEVLTAGRFAAADRLRQNLYYTSQIDHMNIDKNL